MSAAVIKAIFRHQRWQTDRVVHFIPARGANLFIAAENALTASLTERHELEDYEVRALYYLGSPEEANHEPRSA
jgi:uncharacterized protein HemY